MHREAEAAVDDDSELQLAATLRDTADDEGAREALGSLFDRHAARLHAHCLRLTADFDDAEDATASAFIELWQHRQRIVVHDGSALPWLYGVATNVCRNLVRRRRRQRRALLRVADPGTSPDHSDRVDARLDAERRLGSVLAEIDRLPRREREVLALVAWSGLSYAQAATALGIPVGTVRSRLSRARSRLTAADAFHNLAPNGDPR